jgi:hypothetical protein
MRGPEAMKAGPVALTAAIALMACAAVAHADTDYTWTGAGTTSSWQVGTNWAGGLSPTGTVGALDFPQLTSAACTASPPGTDGNTDYSTLTAEGDITLSGATLDLDQGVHSDGNCVDLNPGDIDTLLSANSGTLTGTFANAAPGATVTIDNQCDNSTQSATATINYTSTSVTATILAAGNAGDAAQNTSSPTISGTAAVGQTLTADAGSWSGNPTFTYQWYDCDSSGCNAITGATSTTYMPTSSELGDLLVVGVTGTNAIGANDAFSYPTEAIEQPVPTNTGVPTISGTTAQGDTLTAVAPKLVTAPTVSGSLVVGQTLKAAGADFSGSSASTIFAWERCSNTAPSSCSVITGTNASSYVISAQDAGFRLRVALVATNAAGSAAGVSQPTGVVRSTAQVKAGLAKLLGPSGSGAKLAKVLKHGGYSGRYTAPSSGRLALTWTVKHGGRLITIATFKETLSASGTVGVKEKLTSAGKRLLESHSKSHTKLTLTATIGLQLPTGHPITAKKTLTLKP